MFAYEGDHFSAVGSTPLVSIESMAAENPTERVSIALV